MKLQKDKIKGNETLKKLILAFESALLLSPEFHIPVGIYLLKVSNKINRTRCDICSKLTIKTPERSQCRCSGVFIVNFEHISQLVVVYLLLTLNM